MSMTIAQARESFETETDLAELVREFEVVQRHYQEIVEAMTVGGDEVAPVANSAEVTLSFHPTTAEGFDSGGKGRELPFFHAAVGSRAGVRARSCSARP